jgi:toxin HigB-1
VSEANRVAREKAANPAFLWTISVGHRMLRTFFTFPLSNCVLCNTLQTMIRSFKDKELEKLFEGKYSKSPQHLQKRAELMLLFMEAAVTVQDLRAIPGGFLEQLKGDREGQYSLRVSGNWRLCFSWDDGNIDAVELVDYH